MTLVGHCIFYLLKLLVLWENQSTVTTHLKGVINCSQSCGSIKSVKSTMAEEAYLSYHSASVVSGCQLQNSKILTNKTHLHFQNIRQLLKCCLKCHPRFRNVWFCSDSCTIFIIEVNVTENQIKSYFSSY